MALGQKIKALRTERGMTQERLAEAIYVTRAAISKWETGKGYPGIDSLKLLSEVFGVTIDELISDDDVQAKRQMDMRLSRILYGAAVIFLLGAFVFAALMYELDQPLYYIGVAVCVLLYCAFALATKNEYARIAGKASFDVKRRIARVFAIVLIVSVIVLGGLDIAGILP